MIAGATATGKTGLSLDLADALAAEGVGVEIVSADSRQVYRGMDVGTAKVAPAHRARVPHHALDLVDPDEPFSLADYVRHARAALARIALVGRLALLVGGTGLYVRAVTTGLDPDADVADPDTRAAVEADLEALGLPALVAELRRRAPSTAEHVDPANPRRVVRALERARLAGDRAPPAPCGYPGPTASVGLRLESEDHRRRIIERAEGQFASGLLDEAATLGARYPRELRSFAAFGYREAMAHVAGEIDVETALTRTIGRTNAYARRQGTWFRRESAIEWLPHDAALPRALELAKDLFAAGDERPVTRPDC